MNTLIRITCETCEQEIDCRIGYSNRRIQPLGFTCPHCESQLAITLDISNPPHSNFSFDNCRPADNQSEGPFEGTNPFLDLHLDFPVRYGNYEMGRTPFLMASTDLDKAAGGDHLKSHAMMQLHNARLNGLNEMAEKAGDIKRLINLYSGKNKQLFQRRAAEFLERPEEKSLRPQDVNATLYCVIAKAFFPFVVPVAGKKISETMPQLMQRIDSTKLGEFLDELKASEFLADLQRDCLKIYPRIFDSELPLRPALFLDLVGDAEVAKTAARVSVKDFSELKDLYKDVVEILSRQLVLVAGFNNLLHRGDANSFETVDGGALSDLKKYSAKPLSNKLKYLNDCWYEVNDDAFKVGLRNAVAHNNIQYHGKDQIVAYTPNGGRLEPGMEERMSFLEFTRSLLIAFREMHDLHHVMKTVFYYEFLVRDKADSD